MNKKTKVITKLPIGLDNVIGKSVDDKTNNDVIGKIIKYNRENGETIIEINAKTPKWRNVISSFKESMAIQSNDKIDEK